MGRPLSLESPWPEPTGAVAAQMELLSGLLGRSQPGDLLLLAGGDLAALGGLVRKHIRLHGRPDLLVYDPKAPPARPAATETTETACDEHSLAELLARHLVYQPALRVSLFPPPELAPRDTPRLDAARRALKAALSRAQVNSQTQRLKLKLWLDNLAQNLPAVMGLPELTAAPGAFAGVPALVLGAGPSLDQSLPHLAGANQKALVLAAASALAPLGGIGLAPHLAVALEGKDESRQFAGADTRRTLLAAASSGHPNHLAKWPGPAGVFHLQAWPAALSGLGHCLPTGGHATSAAFSLAVLWGCDPIILAGQDLAYVGGRLHAQGRPGGEDYERPDFTKTPAIGGGVVETSPVMQSYVNWYQEAASYLAGLPNPPRVINASAQGALIPGFQHRGLAPCLAELEDRAQAPDLIGLAQGLPRPQAGFMAQGIARESALARRALTALAQGGPQAAAQAAGPNSAAGWVLGSLPPGAPQEELGQNLEYLRQTLVRMREALHG